MSALVTSLREAVTQAPRNRASGEVIRVVGTTVEAGGLDVQLGSICAIKVAPDRAVSASVVGFREGGRIMLVPLGDLAGVRPGAAVAVREEAFRVPTGSVLLGRILDGLGRPRDGRGPLGAKYRPSGGAAPDPLSRSRIDSPISAGVRAIDSLLTVGKGQRLGIFAGSGVGKSTLLAMIARNALADVNVIALIGERGREVREFVEEQLGPDGLARSVVVVATSDEPPLMRLQAAQVATTIAESFRDAGHDVVFMMDSVTRLAMAQREIGLGAGEPPAMRGYPPSVFAMLPRLLERAGNSMSGTLTGFFTVLVEGDDMNEPIADHVRGILDGHIVLSRRLAERNHFPAIDILASISRVMPSVTSELHRARASTIRSLLAEYEEARDMVEVGAYAAGSNPRLDLAIRLRQVFEAFLRQKLDEPSSLEQVEAAFEAMVTLGLPTDGAS